jgi:hypothetical protein
MILSKETINVALTGDVMMGRLIDEKLNEVYPEYLWGDVLPFLQKADLRLINLEAALTNSDRIEPKVFNFKASPDKVQVLQAASVDIVNLANNHSLDFSREGLIETLSCLEKSCSFVSAAAETYLLNKLTGQLNAPVGTQGRSGSRKLKIHLITSDRQIKNQTTFTEWKIPDRTSLDSIVTKASIKDDQGNEISLEYLTNYPPCYKAQVEKG